MNSRYCVLMRSMAVAGGLVLAVSGCRAAAGTLPPAGAAGATVTSSAATGTADWGSTAGSTPAGGAGAGGAGSLTVSISSPGAVAGHVDTTVSCATAGRRYVESASGVINGATVTEGVRVANYAGPGSYSALITVAVVDADQTRYAVDAVPATVQVTSAGGSVSFSASTSAGRTLAGSISWACS